MKQNKAVVVLPNITYEYIPIKLSLIRQLCHLHHARLTHSRYEGDNLILEISSTSPLSCHEVAHALDKTHALPDIETAHIWWLFHTGLSVIASVVAGILWYGYNNPSYEIQHKLYEWQVTSVKLGFILLTLLIFSRLCVKIIRKDGVKWD